MEKNRVLLNEILVELFNHILLLEERNLKKNGLTNLSITEIHIIEAIMKVNNPSMSDVAAKLMVTVGTLSTSVNRLVQKGYVNSIRSEQDRRVVILSLPEKGKEAFEIHEAFHEKMINKLLEKSHINEDQLLTDSLMKLMEFFDQLKI
ncbi:MAG: MarR family transcriptional regulator [Haloplasmataceae bacterium]|jgi:DNA-binding MarR family transcriptional regulator|nr:MarR family transcriptional regulator [Haloplasmataceae bacterium]